MQRKKLSDVMPWWALTQDGLLVQGKGGKTTAAIYGHTVATPGECANVN